MMAVFLIHLKSKVGLKQGCVLAPTLFGISLSMLLKHVFSSSNGIKLHTTTDGRLFNLASLKANQNLKAVIIRNILFAEDAAFLAYSAQDLQTPMSLFLSAFSNFSLTKSLRKTKVINQGKDIFQ